MREREYGLFSSEEGIAAGAASAEILGVPLTCVGVSCIGDLVKSTVDVDEAGEPMMESSREASTNFNAISCFDRAVLIPRLSHSFRS